MHFNKKQARGISGISRVKKLAVSIGMVSLLGAVTVGATELQPYVETPNAINLKYRAAPEDVAIEGQYIVVLKPEYVSEQVSLMSSGAESDANIQEFTRQAVMSVSQEMASAYGAEVTQQYHATIAGFATKMGVLGLKEMMADSRIDYIEQDQLMFANTVQNNATWGLDRIDQENLPLNNQYVYDLDGSGVTVYVVDTGILSSHSNFGGRVTSGFTAINDGGGTNDCNGHGTHVAGTVGSATYGVAKNVTLVPVRVLGCTGSGSNAGVIAGVDYVAANASGPSVANMSLGGGNSSALDSAVEDAIDEGVTFAVAAGNSNANACTGSPNRVPEALTVASSTSSDARSSFSNFGSCVDLFAPGSSITSTWDNGGTQTISGTSMASPHVAGVAALYLELDPGASPSEVEDAIESAAAVGKISSVSGSPNLLVQTTFGGGPAPSPTPPPTGTPTPTPTPTDPPSGPTPIDTVVENISVGQGQWVRYTLELGSGYSDLNISISGGSGDADLYVNYGSPSSTRNYDCRPYVWGNEETCSFNNPQSGTWHVDIRGYYSSSGVTLTATAE